MNPLPSACSTQNNWRVLYRAAIHETDKNLLLQKLSEAEHAVLSRGHELLYGRGVTEERDDLDDALYALRAYRSASAQFRKAA
jgi:hypothetical protein